MGEEPAIGGFVEENEDIKVLRHAGSVRRRENTRVAHRDETDQGEVGKGLTRSSKRVVLGSGGVEA